MKCENEFYGSATVGDRGQLVIPSEAREELGIEPGEKLLVFKAPHGGLLIVKPDAFESHVRKMSKHIERLQDHLKSNKKDNNRAAI